MGKKIDKFFIIKWGTGNNPNRRYKIIKVQNALLNKERSKSSILYKKTYLLMFMIIFKMSLSRLIGSHALMANVYLVRLINSGFCMPERT